MCLAMNADRLEPGERCASTSNRNFEGRQGYGSRTHLVSPAMAAAAGLYGHFVDVRHLPAMPSPAIEPDKTPPQKAPAKAAVASKAKPAAASKKSSPAPSTRNQSVRKRKSEQ